MPQGDSCWKDWAIDLRKWMMRNEQASVTKSVPEIKAETGTDESLHSLSLPGFWNACRDAKPDWDTIPRQGLNIEFEPNDRGMVDHVTFVLNETWQAIMRRSESGRE